MAPYRIRLTYSKIGAIRYTGHLDLYRVWERAIRRSNLPVAFSNGFHPLVRIAMACPLPLGFTGLGELMDLWLLEPVEPKDILAALSPALPPGLALLKAEVVDPHAPALQTQVRSSLYQVTLLDPVDPDWLARQADALLASPKIERVWRGKVYDLRPYIETLECLPSDPHRLNRLRMRLSAREGATGRPEEVLAALGCDPALTRVERIELILD